MSGVSIDQWRDRIGRFNAPKKFKGTPVQISKYFLISSQLMVYSKFLQENILLSISLLYNFIILFGFCFMVITLLSLFTLTHFLSVWTSCSDSFFSHREALVNLYLVFKFPKLMFILIKKAMHYLNPMENNLAFRLLVSSILLIMAGIETNPGPSCKNLSFAVWNLDSLPAREYARIPLIESLQAEYSFDIFGVCESALTKNIPNETILVEGFSPDPIRADKSDDTRNGGVCLYFREDLPIKSRMDLATMPETIVAEIKLNRKKIFFVLSYRHPNAPIAEVNDYMDSLESITEAINKEKPTAIIVSGDFNARSPLFWEGDTETREGKFFSDFLMNYNMEELIKEPTHIRDNGSQSCIDLICTDQPFLFVDSGVLPSLDSHSKHNIIHGRLNFHTPSPPPYKRRIWDYAKANVEDIRRNLIETNWQALFHQLPANEMALVFTDTALDIFSKNIPNKVVTCHDKDAAWITPEVKAAIKRNSRIYTKWNKRGRKVEERPKVMDTQNQTSKLIRQAKNSYYEKLGTLLSDYSCGEKHFWNAFKKLSNKKKSTNIPPIIENGVYVTDFAKKATIFNDYFAKQCTIHDNGSTLPPLQFRTNSLLSNIVINPDEIVSIILKQKHNKAHGCDNISMAMLKLCPKEIAFPLSLIFQKCIDTGAFPDSWKLANVQPIYKKNNRQIKSNYRPISLLPLCGKILEKVIFDQLYAFLDEKRLISTKQSGFRPGDSCIYQLISITSDIYRNFEKHDETRALFLDISKAFDKVWHDGLIHKLKSNGISGNLLSFLENYLSNRHQHITLNGTESS